MLLSSIQSPVFVTGILSDLQDLFLEGIQLFWWHWRVFLDQSFEFS